MSIPILFLILLLAVPTHQLSELITNTCEQTLYRELCIVELKTAPETVQELPKLTIFALKMAVLAGGEIEKRIGKISKSKEDKIIKQGLSDCTKIYQGVIAKLEDSMKAVATRDYVHVNKLVTASITDSQTCEDSFKKYGALQSPLTFYNTKFHQLCSILLTMSNLLTKDY
ncbi:putative invertase inhibitor [Mercurialis annua]|uniref:putative invertase inhibitor n=1 Tax=Mercurialis annua TaxID=3986 RepID=UPI00216004A9|nr:putative invertase inhibitor [Mercurialis annua]